MASSSHHHNSNPDLYSIGNTSTVLLQTCKFKDDSGSVKIQLYIPVGNVVPKAKEEGLKYLVRSRHRIFIPFCFLDGIIGALKEIRRDNPGHFPETNFWGVDDICPPGKSVKLVSGRIKRGREIPPHQVHIV